MHLDSAERGKHKLHTQAVIDMATDELERGALTRGEWQRRVSDALAAAYLADDDPRWQSGFDGDATLWREARSLVLDAAPVSGTLLDIGCATGYLIESLSTWATERGQNLEFYGLDLNPALAAEARRRLPYLATHIFTGNVSDWAPPQRFSAVRTGLEYVPAGEAPTLLERLAHRFVTPGGRLLVGPVNDDTIADTGTTFRQAWLGEPHVVSATDHRGKTRHVLWAAAPSDTSRPGGLTKR